MHLFTISREDATCLIKIVNKMDIKYFVIICVVLVDVNCECSDYLSCLSNLIHNFFGTSNKTMTNDNNTDLHEVKKYDNSDFDTILSDISSLVNEEVAGEISRTKSKTARYDNNKTNILIKVFEFDHPKGFEKDISTTNEGFEEGFSTTEGPEIYVTLITTTEKMILNDTALTINGIKEVNNMADSSDDFEKNLISSDGVDAYEDLDEKNGTDYPNIDYLELYKDSTVEYVEYVPTAPTAISEDFTQTEGDVDNIIEYSLKIEKKSANSLDDDVKGSYQGNISEEVFPWIVAIFVKNDSKENQFEYYCDGALLSDRFILTAAQCVHIPKGTVDAGSLLIVPGKRSLQSVGDNEKAYRVNSITTHDNFTLEEGIADNDLTILETDESITFNDGVQPASLVENNSSASREAATTGWQVTGELTPIYFKQESSCSAETENTFCATYGYDIATCPSYGGLYVAKHSDKWHLHGIRTGDPSVRGICLDRDISYTDLKQFTEWIKNVIEGN